MKFLHVVAFLLISGSGFAQTKKVELFDLVKMLVQDTSEYSMIGDWAVNSASKYPVKWGDKRYQYGEDLNINFYRNGTANIAINGKTFTTGAGPWPGKSCYISIHADANPVPSLSGSSVYILSKNGASSEAARLLAESENSYELKFGDRNLSDTQNRLASVLLDLSQNAMLDRSLNGAKGVLVELRQIATPLRSQVKRAICGITLARYSIYVG